MFSFQAVHSALLKRFDLQLFLESPDGGEVDASAVREAHDELRTPRFVEFCEMLRTQGMILERRVHRLEAKHLFNNVKSC